MSSGEDGKVEVITFKADAGLAAALNAVENRSEFIRQALRMALDHQCPLCAGAGVLDADQQRHLRAFLQHHEIHKCERCHALHLDEKAEHSSGEEPCPPMSARKKSKTAGRRRTAAALAGLFLLASLVAGAHRHDHRDHEDRAYAPEAHAPHGLCAACVFKASPFLALGGIGTGMESVPIRALPLPVAPFGDHGYPIERRSRAPPSSCA